MGFATVAVMASNVALINRQYAGIAKEGIDPPETWQFENRWKLAAQPGWDAAWESALASHPDDPDYDPGADPLVITDGMILSAIQSLTAGPVIPLPGPEPQPEPEPEPEPKEQ
jgi:hypothetical protein